MRGCSVFTGILFSRKPCPEPAATTCGRCQKPVCKLHVRPQASGPFLCPTCDAYLHDDDWQYSRRDNGWHYRDRGTSTSRSRSADDAPAAAAGTAAGVAAGSALGDEDKAGLATNESGAWHGPDDSSSDADGADGADSGTDDGDFDAS
jgi:hypothetical protein